MAARCPECGRDPSREFSPECSTCDDYTEYLDGLLEEQEGRR